MAHLTSDSGLSKLQAVRRQSAACRISELTCMAYGALILITCRAIESLEVIRVRALCSGSVERSPVINPSLLNQAVLNRKDMNLAIGQFGCVRLLPFGSDRVIDRIAMPGSVGLPDLNIVPTRG